jgi:hypothetical protein
MKNQRKVIIVEFRQGNRSEKGLYGTTETIDGVTTIFIEARQGKGEMLNTFFHELAHAYMHWQEDETIDATEEECVARLVGNVAEPCFRRYKRGNTKENKRSSMACRNHKAGPKRGR